MFFVLIFVFVYIYNGVLFVVEKLRQWRKRMSEKRMQMSDRSVLVGIIVMVILAPLGGFALVHLFPPECEPTETELIVDDDSSRTGSSAAGKN